MYIEVFKDLYFTIKIQSKMTKITSQSTSLSNNTTQPFKSNITKVNNNLFNCTLIINNKNFIIPMRKDGYINATLLCKASGKDIRKWKENKCSTDLLDTFSSLTGIPVSEILNVSRVGKTQNTFAHPNIAIQIAQWCSPLFAIQVSQWTRELMTFGQVTLGHEKSNQELEDKFRDQITQLQQENLKLQQKHNSLTNKHFFYKFKKTGPAFYVIVSGLEYKDDITRVKIGICGCPKTYTKLSSL